ncbi:MAG: T9SS type A sorting domain-containing protein [Ignavibacteriales bacterium]|nr:T9SS type A sorting domain-containing protein [Ignavibacteriales bacterium]
MYELPGEVFSFISDTMGYNYRYLEVADITPYQSFKIGFDLGMTAGKFFKSSRMNEYKAFFELGLNLKDIFVFDTTVSNKKYVFAFDLSSDFSKNFEDGMANLRALLINTMRTGDLFRLLIAGAGQITEVTTGWALNNGNKVNETFDLFQTMPVYEQIKNSFKKKKLVFADGRATSGWTFPGLSDLATIQNFQSVVSSVGSFSSSAIVLAYEHGYEAALSQSQMLMVADSLQHLFTNGGSFLTYYDFNRDRKDLLSKHFIPGIYTIVRQTTNTTLRRVTSGHIGWRYPVEFERAGQYYLGWNPDPSTKANLIEASTERVTTLSRKIQNGYYIVTGMWPFNDDGAFRKMVYPAFMGLNVSAIPPMADTLLKYVKNLHNSDPYQKLIFASNSDAPFDSTIAYEKAEELAGMFNAPKPALGSINLLDGALVDPPVVVFDLQTFYGSGGFLYALANKMGGIHFERSIRDWDYIYENLSAIQYPAVDSLSIEVVADGGISPVYEVRRLKSSSDNKYMPQFFAGRHNGVNKLDITLKVKFGGDDTISTRSFGFAVENDTLKRDFIVPGILATEKINELLVYASYDTAQIVSLSLDNRVLSNYTSMLCLEPNDTIHFMINPWDETVLTGVEDENAASDTLFIEIYPNPFNSMSLIRLNIPEESKLELNIFDITGQLVKTIAAEDGVTGIRQYNWDGTDNFNTTLASGVYLVHVKIRSNSTGKVDYLSKKVIYLR